MAQQPREKRRSLLRWLVSRSRDRKTPATGTGSSNSGSVPLASLPKSHTYSGACCKAPRTQRSLSVYDVEQVSFAAESQRPLLALCRLCLTVVPSSALYRVTRCGCYFCLQALAHLATKAAHYWMGPPTKRQIGSVPGQDNKALQNLNDKSIYCLTDIINEAWSTGKETDVHGISPTTLPSGVLKVVMDMYRALQEVIDAVERHLQSTVLRCSPRKSELLLWYTDPSAEAPNLRDGSHSAIATSN
ncbi:hypothetical protein HPB50_002234 [Hyalomma asiaticum]|uniref:Uncharacterized protein n=1 Tax=Hyalomma asiaticum TaxID=266040 RepID=A0ACB7RII3_HYAAI|nr:hypothetical protein HPB50_002234 [Hyalomma asiaticum]